MPYPIITPEFFAELTDKEDERNKDITYTIHTTPAAVEYVFPLRHERVIRKLMETDKVLSYRLTKLKPEDEAGYEENSRKMIEESPILKHYWTLKILTMNVLQNRDFIFEKRMLLLNFAYKTAQGMIDQSREELIAPFAQDYINKKDYKDIIEFFKEIRPNFAYSECDALCLLRSMPHTEQMDKVCFAVFKNAGVPIDMKSFKFDEGRYLPMKKEYYEVFLKGKEHYIEQVMVNYAWNFCMPFADFGRNIWENFVFFNILFNSIKVMLTCYTYGREDKDEAFVEAITAFDDSLSKVKGNMVKHIVEANAKEGLSNNGDMAILSMS